MSGPLLLKTLSTRAVKDIPLAIREPFETSKRRLPNLSCQDLSTQLVTNLKRPRSECCTIYHSRPKTSKSQFCLIIYQAHLRPIGMKLRVLIDLACSN